MHLRESKDSRLREFQFSKYELVLGRGSGSCRFVIAQESERKVFAGDEIEEATVSVSNT